MPTLDRLVRTESSTRCARRVGAWLLIATLLGSACGGDPNAALEDDAHGKAPAAKKGGAKKPAAAGKKGGKTASPENLKPLAAIAYKDDDFVASLRNRDPFQSYTIQFKAKAPEEMQRRVIMSNTAVEEMSLIAIVTGLAQPKAMLVDLAGVGHVVQRGDYVGRPKLLQATGNVSMAINWRVDRIRDGEVVLTQQDPTDPNRSALTKIIPMRDEVAVK